MYRLIAFVLLCFIILFTCNKDDESVPDESLLPQDSTLFLTYSPDIDQAVSKEIFAESGGSIKATDHAGVKYSLAIPSFAISSDTTLSITPLQSCSLSSEILNSELSFYGAIFEPEGLVFDSAVQIQIEFPDNMDQEFIESLSFAYFDSSSHYIGLMPSTWDESTLTLKAEIMHFSGYAVMETNCDILSIEFNEAVSIAGNSEIIKSLFLFSRLTELVEMAKKLNRECSQGWESSAFYYCDLFLNEQLDFLNDYYGNEEVSVNSFYEFCSYFDALRRLNQYDSQAATSSMIDNYRSSLTNYAEKLKTKAQNFCDEGTTHCHEGEGILYEVLTKFDDNTLTDISLKNDINNILETCCVPIQINMQLSKNTISEMAIAIDYPEQTYCMANIKITTGSGTPVEGQAVYIKCDESSHTLRGGTTDANGEAELLITSRDLDSNFDPCDGPKAYNLYAESYSEQKWVYSSSEIVTIFPVTLSTSLNYQYSASYTSDNGVYSSASASLTGTTISPARTTGICISECEGLFTRDYKEDACTLEGEELKCGSTVVSDYAEITSCIAQIERGTIYIETESDGVKGVPYVSKVMVSAGRSLISNIELTYSGDGGTSTRTTDLGCPWPINPEANNQSVWHLENNGGSTEEMSWEYEPLGVWDHQIASMKINVVISTDAE